MTDQSDGAARRVPQEPSVILHPSSAQTTAATPAKNGTRSLTASRSPSAGNSPWSSREASPAGRHQRQQQTASAVSTRRSRKNSHDISPVRSSQPLPPASVPSAAAIQRALSAATATPQLQPTSATEEPSKIPQRSAAGNHGTPHWPVSPRLKSPPPSRDPRRSSGRKAENVATPNIVVQPATPASTTEENLQKDMASRSVSAATKASSRAGSGAPKLETVQEASLPPDSRFPQDDKNSAGDPKASTIRSDDEQSLQSPTKVSSTAAQSAKIHSESEGAERTQAPKAKEGTSDKDATLPSKTVSTRTSFTSLKPKAAVEASTKNMTVETETVNSVAQSALNAPDRSMSGRGDASGTLKGKASNDTIKPKKERKKQSRKPPSIHAATAGKSISNYPTMQADSVGRPQCRFNQHHHLGGMNFRPRTENSVLFRAWDTLSTTSTVASDLISPNFEDLSMVQSAPSRGFFSYFVRAKNADSRPREASTRADKFEAQVLDAMDQASSDDSDETFVYESNPPEVNTPHRSRGRHHSRTPSVTSMASLAEQRTNLPSISTVLDQRPMQKPRSMKFTNAYSSGDNEDLDRGDGTIRASNTSRGNGVRHHHLGGSRNTTHTSILDDNNPTFPNTSKQRSLIGMAGRGSQNARLAAQNLRSTNSSVKRNGDGYTSYDMDDEPADDERTPLVGTIRGNRNTPRTPRTARRYDLSPQYRRSIMSRCAGCIVLAMMLLLLASGVMGFLFAISKPLSNLAILEIQHVLASEQELMLDLVVEAMNPNLLPITISDMDVNVFAKSKYVGSEKWWGEHPQLPASKHVTDRRKSYQRNYTLSEALFPHDDDRSDPLPDDPTKNKQTMLLGHVYHFDNPLAFDGSFWRQHPHYSTASLRLNKPGNRTELGGTERWERVIEHPFELIVRGVLKYHIPLGGSKHSASVSASTIVTPEKGIQDPDDDGFKLKAGPELSAPRLRFARGG